MGKTHLSDGETPLTEVSSTHHRVQGQEETHVYGETFDSQSSQPSHPNQPSKSFQNDQLDHNDLSSNTDQPDQCSGASQNSQNNQISQSNQAEHGALGGFKEAGGEGLPRSFLATETLRNPAGGLDELQTLRKLLFTKEIEALKALEHRLNDRQAHAEELSDVVAEALLIRSTHDDRLTKVLEPIIGEAFSGLIKRNPRELASELFPLMGPAIRRSIAETFHSMLLSFQKQMEMSFSWRGLRWRLEALRTGKPFSEIVLLHTLVYRVDQAFLIHSQTGLVLGHLAHEGLETQDADLVSAMLTAVQDFVRDCLASSDEKDAELSSMHFGDSTILVEKHPYASLACIVRGTPPANFRERMASTLEMVLVTKAQELTSFSGDVSGFTDVLPYLEDCLVSHAVDEDKPLSVWVKLLPVVVLLFLGLVWGGFKYTQMVEKRAYDQRAEELSKSIESLRLSTGITVIEVREGEDKWEVYCLKDMLAPSPEEYLAYAGRDSQEFVFHVTPVISYTPEVVMTHVLQTTKPPEGVAAFIDKEGTLHFVGTASTGWQLQARNKGLALPGVNDVNMDEVFDPQAAELEKLVDTVESAVIGFPFSRSIPVGEEHQKLVMVIDALVNLERLAKSMGMSVALTVYGHADKVGTDKTNYEISQARATTIASMLYSHGSSIPLSLYAMGAEHARGSDETGFGDMASRRVELKVHLQQSLEPQKAVLK